MCCCWYS